MFDSFQRYFAIFLFLIVVLPSQISSAQEIGFVEEFALSTDRAKTLQKLVPGTEEYYYFHCLHYLNTEKFDEADELLKPWAKRLGETELFKRIEARAAILKYDNDPKATTDFLKNELKIFLDHQREIPQAQRNLPNTLDQNLIDSQRLIARYQSRSNGLNRIADYGLVQVDIKQLNRISRRQLLQRIRKPDFPNLVELVAADLKERDSGGFGSIPVHASLTLEQLNQLARLDRRLGENNRFIDAVLRLQMPSNDVDLAKNREAYAEYLSKLQKIVAGLGPKFNSLKANILYHQLVLDQKSGVYNEDKFREYLALPRQIYYVNPTLIKTAQRVGGVVNLGVNYSRNIMTRPIGNEEPLVRDYLQHFFREADSYTSYQPLLQTSFLKENFATAKILSGNGDVERWISLLSPAAYKALLSRVDIEFSPTNPEHFSPGQPVQLDVNIKNVDKLLVKVFEINTFNYYRKLGREIDTDVSLDGLVANWEKTYEYDSPPALQVKRQFKFEQIKKPGVYVVDFIGNGKSSRALIRIGRMSLIETKTLAGHAFRVMNQEKEPVTKYNLWISGQRYSANENGLVVVPYSNRPSRVPVIITSDDFSCLDSFQHSQETYSLESALVVDRETLLRNEKSHLLIRPLLKVSGVPTELSLLKNISVDVTTTNLDGTTASKKYDKVELGSNAETVVEFRVPPRLKSITFRLAGSVENVSQAKDETVEVSRTYQLNGIDSSDQIRDVHLVPHSDGYTLEVLGKSGEARPKQAVNLNLQTFELKEPVRVTLQSDENGQIDLGKLENIRWISAQLVNGKARKWNLRNQNESLPRVVHRATNELIEFVAPADLERSRQTDVSLFEIRGGKYYQDVSKSISIQDDRLRITGLQPGDYELSFRKNKQTVSIRVTEGKSIGEVLVGDSRRLEQRTPTPVTIKNVAEQDQKIRIQLDGVNNWTRVHVFADRYAPAYQAYPEFAKVANISPWTDKLPERKSSYMSGRRIGDEYKYILDRRYASQFPGNMLDRPSLLVNPWKLRDTDNKQERLAAGDDFAAGGLDSKAKRKPTGGASSQVAQQADFANLDFLADEALVAANLRPDKNGFVEVDKELIGNRQHLRIVVNDAFSTVVRNHNLKLQQRKIRDLRMVNVMDADKNFSQSREVNKLNTGEEFVIDDILSAKFQSFDDLSDVFRLFRNKSDELGKFDFILSWPKFDDAKKQELYSKFACHELNFFLFKKDKEFFNRVVSQHISFKRNKTFMDLWLLEKDVADFARTRQFQRLNTAERILLSERLEEYRREIVRNINDQYLLSPTDRQYFGRLFDDALASAPQNEAMYFALDESESLERSRAELGELADMDKAGAPGAAYADPQNAAVNGRAFKNNSGGRGGAGFGGGGGGRSRGRRAVSSLGLPVMEKVMEKQKAVAGSKIYSLQQQESSVILGGLGRVKGKDLQLARKSNRRLYRRVKKTAEYIENNYWHLAPEKVTPQLIPVNRFWRDYSNHNGGLFLSPYFAEANSTFTEMMFALALIDLPFEAGEHETEYADAQMNLKAASPMIVLHQQVQPAILDRGNTSILVSENFFQKNDRYRNENGVRYDKFVNDEFVAHTLYGGQVVVTNPTSTPQMIDLLIQLPKGAVVASGSQQTQTIQRKLNAFSTQTYEYFFYFPMAGQYPHFPAHVSANDKVLAVANPISFKVTDSPTKIDKSSWAYVSQNGSNDDVLNFLRNNNIIDLDLTKIAFRMKDKAFFESTTKTLRNRLVYNHVLWGYSTLHNDEETLQEFLANENRIASWCQPYFKSSLVQIDPVDRRWYYHREYRPLINARTHQVGKERKILNPVFRAQYLQLMNIASHKSQLTNDDQLVVTYYLLLQDRIEEALTMFAQVNPAQLNVQLQYDYCDAYLDMYREKPDDAAQKAERWVSYPVDHWRERFQNIIAQVEEIRGGSTTAVNPKDTTQSQTASASESESFEFELLNENITLRYQNIEKITVNYYEMDIELLFSRNPFAQDNLDGFSLIRPNVSSQVQLDMEPEKLMTHKFDLPAELQNKNVLVEIVAGDQAKSKPYFANRLTIQMVEKFGQVKVMDENGRPVSKAYVKVYHRDQAGNEKFHKDGYTDLRGRFDYVSQSNNPLDGIEKYSILILHQEYGAVIRQAMPPKE